MIMDRRMQATEMENLGSVGADVQDILEKNKLTGKCG